MHAFKRDLRDEDFFFRRKNIKRRISMHKTPIQWNGIKIRLAIDGFCLGQSIIIIISSLDDRFVIQTRMFHFCFGLRIYSECPLFSLACRQSMLLFYTH